MFEPEEQALPPEAAIPCISKLKSSIELHTSLGKQTLSTVYRLLLGSIWPLKEILWSISWSSFYHKRF